MSELTRDAVLAELQPVFREALDSPNLTVTYQSSGRNTPNWDSLAHIELIEMVESIYHVHFALGELQDLREVGDLVDLIIEKRVKLG